jgi:hypothetical protein
METSKPSWQDIQIKPSSGAKCLAINQVVKVNLYTIVVSYLSKKLFCYYFYLHLTFSFLLPLRFPEGCRFRLS